MAGLRAGGHDPVLYDGGDLIQESDGAGNLLRDYDHLGTDEPLIWHEYAAGSAAASSMPISRARSSPSRYMRRQCDRQSRL